MNSTIGNAVHSLHEFEDVYVNPVVKSLYDGLYSMNHEDGYNPTNHLKSIIEAFDNLDTAVNQYSELFDKVGEASHFRNAVNRMVIHDIDTSLSTYSSSFSNPFKTRDLEDLKESTTGISDYHQYVQSFIDWYAKRSVENGYCDDIVATRNQDQELLFDTDDVSYLSRMDKPYEVVMDLAEFGNPFKDIRGNSWLPCMLTYAHGDYAPTLDLDIDGECISEGYMGLAIPIDDTGNAVINGTKRVFEKPACIRSLEVIEDRHSGYTLALDDYEFYQSTAWRRGSMVNRNPARHIFNDMDEYSVEIREDANKEFNKFMLGSDKPNLFDDNGTYYVETESYRARNKQSFSLDTLSSMVKQYQIDQSEKLNRHFDFVDEPFVDAQEFDTLNWEALSDFVPVVTEAKPSQSTPDKIVSELKPTDTVKYNKAVDTYDITDN